MAKRSNHNSTSDRRSAGSGKSSRQGQSRSRQQTQNQQQRSPVNNGNRTSGSGKRSAKSSNRSGNAKVTQYRKPINLNFGVIILVVILIYVVYSVIRYATAKHVVAYEVRSGSIASDQVYQGLILREETVVDSEYSGYINYYSPEKDRLSTGSLAYTIDESGQIQSYLTQSSSSSSVLSDSDYQTISSDIASFEEGFTSDQFEEIYDFKSTLTSTIQKLSNSTLLKDLSTTSSSSLHYCNTTDTGYIIYDVDGYEGKTFEDLTISDFDSANYSATELTNGSLVTQGDSAYKLETAEDWEIAIQTSSKEEADALVEKGVVKVRFLKNQYEAWATIGETRDLGYEHYIVQLKFTNSMMTFCTDRFLSIEIEGDAETGLKVPKSALIDDTFYVVPREYVTTGVGGDQGVLRQVVDSDGEKSTEFISVTPYTNDDDEDNYYLDQQTLRDGDVLVKPDSSETLTLANSMTDTLTGVYNINKGYADFRQVTKIAENDEYAIVKANSTYGLREYDYIVLNASTMSPDEFLYE